MRTAALRGGSGVLALPFPLSDFDGVCTAMCADGLWVGGRIRSEVQAVPPRGGIVIVTVKASDGGGEALYLSRRRDCTRVKEVVARASRPVKTVTTFAG